MPPPSCAVDMAGSNARTARVSSDARFIERLLDRSLGCNAPAPRNLRWLTSPLGAPGD
jgi:hypothetical protein